MRALPERFVVACAIAGLVSFGSCGTTTRCSASNCASGCCDGAGACQRGSASTACGSLGSMCVACEAGATCSAGMCQRIGDGSGGGSGGAGGAGCADNQCRFNTVCVTQIASRCGRNGSACVDCSLAGAACNVTTGQCESCSGCLDASDVCQPGTTAQACGSAGARCQSCPSTHTCSSSRLCVARATCDATSCPSGCCQLDTCVPFASQTDQQCGSQGAACGACTNGDFCDGQGLCMTGNGGGAGGAGGGTGTGGTGFGGFGGFGFPDAGLPPSCGPTQPCAATECCMSLGGGLPSLCMPVNLPLFTQTICGANGMECVLCNAPQTCDVGSGKCQ